MKQRKILVELRFEYRSKKITKELAYVDLSDTVESGKMHNITSKAGRLAMELSAEKNALHKSLKSCKENSMILSP